MDMNAQKSRAYKFCLSLKRIRIKQSESLKGKSWEDGMLKYNYKRRKKVDEEDSSYRE